MTLTTMVPIAMELRHLWQPDVARPRAQRPSPMTMHLTPGRLRLRLLERRGDEAFARQVEQALAPLPGVTQVRANPVTGSVLVLFDPQQLDAQQILAELERWALISRQVPPPAAAALPFGEVATRIGTTVGKELAKAALLEAVGEAWFTPLLALL